MSSPAAVLTAPATGQRTAPASLSVRALAAALFALFALDNILLLGLLGYSPLLVGALALILPGALAAITHRALPGAGRVELSTLLLCLAVAALLLLLGGEGRVFFATDDWQIRDAVLADMGNHHWPFDYWLDGRAQILRAPVGMYLIPALIGGASQIARDWALLIHNSLILGLLFALGSALFEGRRARLIALVTFVMFSGLDVIGNLLLQSLTGEADWDHIERWAHNYQFSAHITQIFWVPQHAFAGWTVALLYLLWRRGIAPIGLFAAGIPLVALWSPFAIFGALPFAVFAGIRALVTRDWDGRDVALAGLALLITLPALAYLHLDADAVGSGLRPPLLILYVLIIGLEVLPFLGPLLRDRSGHTDRVTMLIVGACLLLMPLWAVGAHTDFQMRASIPALAILALVFADWAARRERIIARTYIVAILALGSVTGSAEIYRALALAPSPVPGCSLQGIWARQTGLIVPHAAYFASRAAVPPLLAPVPPVDRAGMSDPAHCWPRSWRVKRGAL